MTVKTAIGCIATGWMLVGAAWGKTATSPVYSPDGTKIALQVEHAGQVDIAVVAADGTNFEWITKGPGHACHPSWGADGSLLYVKCPETRTAYAAWKAGSKDGYNVYLYKDGRETRLTEGGHYDSTPSFSPDMQTVYFASDGALASDQPDGHEGGNIFCALDMANRKVRLVRCVPGGGDGAGVAQPVVSPDGRYTVWAEQDGLHDTWHLMAAKRGDEQHAARITPKGMTAYSPRWAKDGRYLVCVGFRKGDPTWGVYIVEVQNGAVKRLCDGRDCDISPDMKKVVYATEKGRLAHYELGKDDFPHGGPAEAASEYPPERVLARIEYPERNHDYPLDPRFVSTGGEPMFVRVRVKVTGILRSFEHLFVGSYENADTGFQLYHVGNDTWFATRCANTDFAGSVDKQGLPKDFDGTVTGVRNGKTILVQIGDRDPVVKGYSSLIDLAKPLTFHVGRPQREGFGSKPFSGEIASIEYGLGWPANVKRERTLKEVFE